MSNSQPPRDPSTHRIRLGSQWDFETLLDIEPSPDHILQTPPANSPSHKRAKPERLKEVADYKQAAGATYQGRIRLVRWFGRPSGLQANDRVELGMDLLQNTLTVSLNGQELRPLAADQPIKSPTPMDADVRFDVSLCLQDRNRLAIELDLADNPEAAGILREVWLEIHSADQ